MTLVRAVFVELPAFDRHRDEYLSDEALRMLEATLMKSPEAGDSIEGTGGLRELRFADSRRGKGKRGGLAGDLLLVARRVAVLALHPLRQR